jgi:hypothetical protein
MLGLTFDEMMQGDIDYILHRFNGWAMLNKYREQEEWKRARLVGWIVAKSAGATKAKDPEKFMPLEKKQSRLSEADIERLKNGFDKL